MLPASSLPMNTISASTARTAFRSARATAWAPGGPSISAIRNEAAGRTPSTRSRRRSAMAGASRSSSASSHPCRDCSPGRPDRWRSPPRPRRRPRLRPRRRAGVRRATGPRRRRLRAGLGAGRETRSRHGGPVLTRSRLDRPERPPHTRGSPDAPGRSNRAVPPRRWQPSASRRGVGRRSWRARRRRWGAPPARWRGRHGTPAGPPRPAGPPTGGTAGAGSWPWGSRWS